jgi:hypothetical protein
MGGTLRIPSFETLEISFFSSTKKLLIQLFGDFGFGTFFVLLTFLSVAIFVISNQFSKTKKHLSSFTEIYKKNNQEMALLSRLFVWL